MKHEEQLNEREQRVLDAVIRSYVESAEPAGSRTVARRFQLGISPATVRNTMADLEEKGFLYHPHTSAGRIPTDRAYRFYVDALIRPVRLSTSERRRLREELESDSGTPLERLLRRSAQALGIISGELGLAVSPALDQAVLERLELLSVSDDKVLLVLTLRSGAIRTVYIDLPGSVPTATLLAVTMILNERLAGQTLKEIRETLPERLRDSAPADDAPASELLNIFLQSADDLLQGGGEGEGLHLGRASVLASQPEFASGSRLRSLIELTEQRDVLARALSRHDVSSPLEITIGQEHEQPELSGLTLITSKYSTAGLTGVIGVIGPTRMPYEKVIAIVESASHLLSAILGEA